MGLKSAGVGLFTIPTAPAAGTSCTSGAANTFTTTYVQLIASTAAAIYVTGIHLNFQTTSKPTYVVVQLATGGAGSETIVGQILVPIGDTSGVTGVFMNEYVNIWPPIPIATSTRIACKTADSVGSLAALVTLQAINQSNVVDAGVNESANVLQWNSTNVSSPATAGIPDVNVKNMNNVAATSITTINANQGTTQPINFTGTGASALAKSDMVDIAGAAVSTTTAQIGVNGVQLNGQTVTATAGVTFPSSVASPTNITSATGLDITKILGTAISTPATAGILDVNVKNWVNAAPNALTSGKVDAIVVIRGNTAQAGAAGSITLDAGASATDNFYRGARVLIASATGAGQVRLITGYTGSSKVAAVAPNWTTNPDSTSVFIVTDWAGVDLEQVALTAQTARDLGGQLDAAISTRMATYAQPTGFLATTFPSSVASPTNITAGTITTTTNLTNAPTSGDFTSTMKASLNAATPASVTGAVGSVTARVTANTDQWAGGTIPTPNVTGVPLIDLKYILGTVLTETAGQIAAAFKKFFNIATPASTMDHLTLIDTTTSLTNAATITGDLSATMKTSVQAAADAAITANATVTEIESETDAIKAQTDKLAFTVTNQVDANIKSVNSVTVNGDGATTPWGP